MCPRSDSAFSHSYSQSGRKSCFLCPSSQSCSPSAQAAGMTAGARRGVASMLSRRSRARPCGLDGACEHNSQARFKVSQGACTRQGPQLLPNPTRARQPGRAQTSSALTRLTVKAQQNLLAVWRGLRAPVLRAGSLGEAHSLAAESSERGALHRLFAQSLQRSSSPLGKRGVRGQWPLIFYCVCLCCLMMTVFCSALLLFLQCIKSRGRKGQFPNGANEIKGPARCSHSQLSLLGSTLGALGRPGCMALAAAGCCSRFSGGLPRSAPQQRTLWCGHGWHTLAPPGPPSNLTLR
ncbi:hypothetical protein L207DRAFT_186215 [Hyaloscypha variabilis F]|uniref:Uncharacterized protein n=1 Tax=Hyaloscypha variabilis (strain UAMH 11265 / GT02V1 / F) TaxID=1149755 RepID=A0A2J6QZX5_HYAVF|nr:hypothetical protein L207DRAFT_186215 [Hyaloscypha variabilis F]